MAASGDERAILTLDDFNVVKRAVFKARMRWRPMGTELGISQDDLDNIEDEGDNNEECLENMLRVWLRTPSLCPTWKALVKALRDQTVGREDVAIEIKKKYLMPAVEAVAVTQPQLGPTPDQKSALQKYLPFLKSRYRRKVPGSMVQFLPPTDKYTDLSLIDRQGLLQGGSAVREMVRLTVEGKVGDILKMSNEIELKDLFKLDQKERKVILIEGPPGSGKTTLAWHVCQEWESGKLFSKFDLVVYVQLRYPAIQAARSIADLFPRRNNQMAEEVLAELEAKDGKGVLFVLDGWDELPGELPRDSPLRQLIEPALVCPLEQSAVIVTSRPEASTELHNLASSRVQIVGFTPEKVENFFTESLKGDSQATKALLERVKENPVIEGSCYIPLIATILVTVFAGTGKLPSSLTDVFVSLVTYCILRHCMRGGDKIRNLPSLDELPPALQPTFDCLCALAFQGILVNQITFSEEECEIYPDFATLSVLQAVEGFLDMGLKRTYNFPHLSIQELLAARHISKLLSGTQIDIVHCLLDHPRFAGVVRFYAGITHLRRPGVKGIIHKIVQTYKDELQREMDKKGILLAKVQYLMVLLLECLHEGQDPTVYQMVAEEWGDERLCFLFLPSPDACQSAGYLLPRLSYPHIKLSRLNDQHIVLFMKGLSNGCVDLQQPRSGLSITLSNLSLSSRDGFQGITQLLSSSFSISHLVLGVEYWSPMVVWRYIGKAMATNTSVRSLQLEQSQLLYSVGLPGDSPGPGLCEMLEKNKTLETLIFTGFSNIGPYVAKGLVHNTTLKELVLYGCNVTDTGAKSLADMLMSNTTLETLEISSSFMSLSSNISAEGVGHLAEALKVNSTLRVLKFRNYDVCKNAEPLSVALTVNTTLERLEITEPDTLTTILHTHIPEKLPSNEVLQQLLTIAIERTVNEFGGEETGRALMTILEEWRNQEELRSGLEDWKDILNLPRKIYKYMQTTRT